MSLSGDINISVQIQAPQVSQAGQNMPMILSQHNRFAERSRVFETVDELFALGFSSSDAEVIEAQALKAQQRPVRYFKLGRRATPVAQVVTLQVVGTQLGLYRVEVGTLGTASFTATGSPTTQDIRNGLKTQLDAIAAAAGVTVANVSTDSITLTASQAGIPFLLALTSPSGGLTQALTTPGVGIAEDLVAISDYDPDWYGLLLKERDGPSILAAARALAGQDRIFFGQSNESGIINTVYNTGVSTDTGARLKDAAYLNTALWYAASNTEAQAAAMMGYGLARNAGTMTYKWKSPVGPTPFRPTTTQLKNIQDRSVNGIRKELGANMSYEGTVASGEFIDNITGIHRLKARIQTLTFALQLANDKVPLDTDGLAMLGAQVGFALQESTDGLIGNYRVTQEGKIVTPGWEVVLPSIAQISPTDRAKRRIPPETPITFSAQYRGAIGTVNIAGKVYS